MSGAQDFGPADPLYPRLMCAQCAATGAVVATGAAAATRVWLFAIAPAWLTRSARTFISAFVIVAGVLAAGLLG